MIWRGTDEELKSLNFSTIRWTDSEKKKRFWICSALCLIISVIYAVIFWRYGSTKYRQVSDEIYGKDKEIFTALLQRIKPFTITSYQTRLYMSTVGLIEIVMKSLTLMISIGAALVIRYKKQQLENLHNWKL